MAFVCSMHHRRPFYEQVGQEIKLTSMNSRQIHTSKRLLWASAVPVKTFWFSPSTHGTSHFCRDSIPVVRKTPFILRVIRQARSPFKMEMPR